MSESAMQDLSAGKFDGRFENTLSSVFAENDTNSDGNLSLAEIANGMASSAGSQASLELLPVLKLHFAELANLSGDSQSIQRSDIELLARLRRANSADKALLSSVAFANEHFTDIDRNSDGLLSRNELVDAGRGNSQAKDALSALSSQYLEISHITKDNGDSVEDLNPITRGISHSDLDGLVERSPTPKSPDHWGEPVNGNNDPNLVNGPTARDLAALQKFKADSQTAGREFNSRSLQHYDNVANEEIGTVCSVSGAALGAVAGLALGGPVAGAVGLAGGFAAGAYVGARISENNAVSQYQRDSAGIAAFIRESDAITAQYPNVPPPGFSLSDHIELHRKQKKTAS